MQTLLIILICATIVSFVLLNIFSAILIVLDYLIKKEMEKDDINR